MSAPATTAPRRRFAPGVSLRKATARGSLVNGAFLVGLNVLQLARGFIVAGMLTTFEYGVWGVLSVVLVTLLWFRQSGLGDKFVQQDEDDQEAAFQKAFTLEVSGGVLFMLAGAGLVPLLAWVYDEPELVAPGLVVCAIVPALALQSPLGIFYRRMDFVRQRTLQAVDPLLASVVIIALAAAGLGYWALVIGTVAGAYAGAIVALIACPYRLRWNLDRTAIRDYGEFSWPIFLAGGSAVLLGNGLVAAGQATVGLAGVGAIALAATLSQFADRADQAITATIYPAICAVKDRTDVLLETFRTSNRLALLWGVPFGLGVALFADDLVTLGLGPEWEPSIVLMQATGIAAAAHQLGFNWSAFYRARGDTKPIGVYAGVGAAGFLLVTLPLMLAFELDGLAIAILAVEAMLLATRWAYLRRLFPRLRFGRHAVRALAPVVPAVAVVLLLRASGIADERTVLGAFAEALLYCVLVLGVTAVSERPLLRELAGYLRRETP